MQMHWLSYSDRRKHMRERSLNSTPHSLTDRWGNTPLEQSAEEFDCSVNATCNNIGSKEDRATTLIEKRATRDLHGATATAAEGRPFDASRRFRRTSATRPTGLRSLRSSLLSYSLRECEQRNFEAQSSIIEGAFGERRFQPAVPVELLGLIVFPVKLERLFQPILHPCNVSFVAECTLVPRVHVEDDKR